MWAPNAERVSVVGDFNGWDGRVHPMRLLVPSGVWEIFIPDLEAGERYKFEIRTRGRAACSRRPIRSAFDFEVPPRIGVDRARPSPATSGATQAWMAARAAANGVARPADVDLRGAPRIVAARAGRGQASFLTYRELADAARAVREGDGLHAHRAAAGDGAPVRRVVGLPGARASSRRRAASARRRTSRSSSTRATGRASA